MTRRMKRNINTFYLKFFSIVKGFEIDKIGTTNLVLDKARTTASVSAASTPVRIGNRLRIKYKQMSFWIIASYRNSYEKKKPQKLFW